MSKRQLAIADKEFKDYVDRLGEGLGRLGKTNLERLSRILSWVNKDPATLRKGDWLNLMEDLQGLAFLEKKTGPSPVSPNETETRTILGEIRNIVEALLRNASWSFVETGVKHIIGRPRGRVLHLITGNLRSQVLLSVFRILEAEGHRLKRCLECKGKIFIAMKRQVYCSIRCSQRVRSRRFFASHRDGLYEKRRSANKKRIEKQQGRPTKVPRRKRRQAV